MFEGEIVVDELEEIIQELCEMLKENWIAHNPTISPPNFITVAQSIIDFRKGKTLSVSEICDIGQIFSRKAP